MKLYRCEICGKIVAEINETNVTPSCCGQNMTELAPQMSDGVLEKHVPVYERKGTAICVTIGEALHPMTETHHIEFIILETNKGFYLNHPYTGDGSFPGSCFRLGTDEVPKIIMEYCNLHGLYVTRCSENES